MALMWMTGLLVGFLVTLGASTSTGIDGDTSCKLGDACENKTPEQEDISALFQSKSAQVLTERVLPKVVADQNEASTRPRMQKLMEINATVHDIKDLIGAGNTPEVSGLIHSLNVIIKTEIQVKIKLGHTNAQEELDHRVDVLTTTTETAVGLKASADQVDKSYDKCVTEEKQALEAYHTCKAEEAALIGDRPTAAFCGNPDFDIAYTNPPQLPPILNVDFSKGLESVHDELDHYMLPLHDFIAKTKAQAAVDQIKWDAADKKCTGIIYGIVNKTRECGQSLAAWRAQHEKCGNENAIHMLSLCEFGHAYQIKCAAKTAFDALKADIVGSGTVWSESDRENEFSLTTKLICLLENFNTVANLNTEAVSDCTKLESEAAAQFTKDVGPGIVTNLSTYDALTSEAAFTCAETHLTFGTGALWTVPVKDAVAWIPNPASYTKSTSHSYAIESDSSHSPFDFCIGTCCMAMTAQCLACQGEVSVAEYCSNNPTTKGCPSISMAPECVGLNAAVAAYRFGGCHGCKTDGDAAKAVLEAEGYNFVRGYNKSTSDDWDYMGLWNKDSDCVITFQGSTHNADYSNNWDHTPVDFMGLPGVHQGLTTELGGLLDQVNFAAVKERCTGNLMVAGHSLGGGLAQLFAGVINSANDPLKARLHVDNIFTFGAMPVSQTPFRSAVDSDGCFGGSAFFTARHNADGTDGVDIVANKLVGGTDQTFDPVRTSKVLLFGAGANDREEFACGNQLPLSRLADTGFDLHSPQLYGYYTGCMNATEFTD